MSADIKIYIANLGKYNEGELVGEWFTLPIDDISEALETIGVVPNTCCEEYAIHDFETSIPGLKIGEYESLENLNAQAERLEGLDEYDIKKLCAIVEVETSEIKTALDYLEDNYEFYEGFDLKELAEEFVAEGCFGSVPDSIQGYIDYDAIVRDMEIEGYTETKYGVLFSQ